MKILVFDTETSGLPPNEAMNVSGIKYGLLSFNETNWNKYLVNWPLLLQLTYFIYDDETKEVIKIYDYYVDLEKSTEEKINNDIILLENTSPSGASILKDNMMRLNNSKDKKSLCNIVCDFLNDLEKSDLVVGHNINFDILMMIASAKRVMLDNNCDCSNLNNLIELLNREKLNKMCTMKDGTEICEIPRITKTGKTVKKMINVIDESGSSIKIEKIMFKGPKLIVLFDKLFNINIDTSKLHDSKYDVLITLLVYLKLKDPSFTLPNTSNILTTNTTMREYYNLLNNITMKTGGKRKYKKKSVKKIKRNKITKKKNMRKKKKTLRRKKYSKKNFLKNTKL